MNEWLVEPPPRARKSEREAVKACMVAKAGMGDSTAEMKKALAIECLRTEVPLKADAIIAKLESDVAAIDARTKHGLALRVSVDGLPSSDYSISRWEIAPSSANACGMNKATEATPSQKTCGENGALDEAGRELMELALGDLEEQLVEEGVSEGEADAVAAIISMEWELEREINRQRNAGLRALGPEGFGEVQTAMTIYSATRKTSGPEAAWSAATASLRSGGWSDAEIDRFYADAVAPIEAMAADIDARKASLTPEHRELLPRIFRIFRDGALEARMIERAAELNRDPRIGLVEAVETTNATATGRIELSLDVCPYCVELVTIAPATR